MNVSSTSPLAKLHSAFAFGGGLLHGGLSKDAMKHLGSIWSFDYMGAAEYEWGAVPKALAALMNFSASKNLDAYEFQIRNVKIYLICPPQWRSALELRIRAWAEVKNLAWDDPNRVRDWLGLHDVVMPDLSLDQAGRNRVVGWLELDNGYMFFTDRVMFVRACQEIFGISPAGQNPTADGKVDWKGKKTPPSK